MICCWENGILTPSTKQVEVIEKLYDIHTGKAQDEWFNSKDKDLPKKLQEFRLERRLSRQDLADAVGVNRATLRGWECNDKRPSARNIRKLRDLQAQEDNGEDLGAFLENFPQKLENLCTYLPLTKSEFAKVLGVSTTTLLAWTSGLHVPSVFSVNLVATFCTKQGIDFNNLDVAQTTTVNSDDIKKLRKQFGFTQKQLTGNLSVGSNTIALWESKRRKPSKKFQRKLGSLSDRIWLDLFRKLDFLLEDKEFSVQELAEELTDISGSSIKETTVLNWMAKVSYPNDNQLACLEQLLKNFNYKPQDKGTGK